MCNPIPTAVPQQRDTRQPRPTVVRPVEWHWLLKPVGGRSYGYLEINHQVYQVAEQQFEHPNGMADRLWDLRKPDGTTYRVCADRDQDLACDCPDATYRERPCKHIQAVVAAFGQLARADRLAAFLAEPVNTGSPAPADVDVPF